MNVNVKKNLLSNSAITAWASLLSASLVRMPLPSNKEELICSYQSDQRRCRLPGDQPPVRVSRSMRLRASARVLLAGGTLTEKERAFLAAPESGYLTTRDQYKRIEEVKRLRDRYDVVALGDPMGGEIVILSKPLVIRWEVDDSPNLQQRDIGRYWIGVWWGEHTWETWIYPEDPDTSVEGWYYRLSRRGRDVHYHPHADVVSKDSQLWSRMCVGDADHICAEWCRIGDWERMFIKIEGQLETYTYPGAFKQIAGFLAPMCSTCSIVLTEGDSKCGACFPKCDVCERHRAVEFYPICRVCGTKELVGPCCNTSRRCVICGKYLCSTCRYAHGQACGYCDSALLEQIGVFDGI